MYHRRWEIEAAFRELQLTQRLEASLRSRTAASIRDAVRGHVVYDLLVRWLLVEAAQSSTPNRDLLGVSFLYSGSELWDVGSPLATAATQDVPRSVAKLLHHLAPLRVDFRQK